MKINRIKNVISITNVLQISPKSKKNEKNMPKLWTLKEFFETISTRNLISKLYDVIFCSRTTTTNVFYRKIIKNLEMIII